MNMNQKGFANIVLVAVVILLVGVVGYFVFVKKSVSPTNVPAQNNVVNNEVEIKPFISPSKKIINSDKEIEFTFSAPKEATQSKIYLSCETGLSAYFSDNITPRTPTPYPNICNTWKENKWVTVQPDPALVRDISDIKFKNDTTQGKVATLQMTVTMSNGASLKSDLSIITINPEQTPLPVVKNEITSWNSYTYSSTKSGILPNITFKYPSVFGNDPTLISSRKINRPSNISEDWGGFVEFNPTGTFGDRGLRIEFFKRVNSENSFESYVLKSSTSGGWSSLKYFQAGNYKVARIRFDSSSHYDADVGWYFIELSNKSILAISTSGDKKYLYDDDQSGNSTRDQIVSTFVISQ